MKSAPPTCTGKLMTEELALLPAGTHITEGQHGERTDRCHAAAPDLVVCGLGLAVWTRKSNDSKQFSNVNKQILNLNGAADDRTRLKRVLILERAGSCRSSRTRTIVQSSNRGTDNPTGLRIHPVRREPVPILPSANRMPSPSATVISTSKSSSLQSSINMLQHLVHHLHWVIQVIKQYSLMIYMLLILPVKKL
jgi:hypothetical protein